MKIITYWEEPPLGRRTPAYILCCLASMRRALGDDFLLLTKDNLCRWIDFDFNSKQFYFSIIGDKVRDSISKIVAKSDFLRFKFILEHGGFWLDADSIVLRNFLDPLRGLASDGHLVWHSEQLFGSPARNSIINSAVSKMVEADRQIFGNPGGIKEMIQERRSDVKFIPLSLVDPTGHLSYTAKTWEHILAEGVRADQFIANKQCAVIKLYNSMLSSSTAGSTDIQEFIHNDSLLSSLFLHLVPNPNYWIEKSRELQYELGLNIGFK